MFWIAEHVWPISHNAMGLLPDTWNYRLRMGRECFPRHHGLAIPICIAARVWRTCLDACQDRQLTVSLKSVAGKTFRHSWYMRNPQFYISSKRPIDEQDNWQACTWLSVIIVTLWYHIHGLVQDCSNSSASAMEYLQSCTLPPIWHHRTFVIIDSGNALLPVWFQAITWTNTDLLSIGQLGTKLIEIQINIVLIQ